jgi:hypothetical protein
MVAIVIGLLGLGASAALFWYWSRKSAARERHGWLAGLVALFPAWLVAFLSLLPDAAATDLRLPKRALFSSGAGLLGIIATDYLVRTLPKKGVPFPAWVYWLLGCVSLVPALLIAL